LEGFCFRNLLEVEDIECLGQMNVPGHESVREIPRRTLQFFWR